LRLRGVIFPLVVTVFPGFHSLLHLLSNKDDVVRSEATSIVNSLQEKEGQFQED
jgi:hypothetical protein